MEAENKWDNIIIESILANKDLKIKEVHNLESLKDLLLDRAQYSNIIELIKNQNWKEIDNLTDAPVEGFREYLSIMKFWDENKKSYAVTIYDSDELWQDPEIIEIFLLSPV